MVENHVHHNLQSFLVCLVNQATVFLVGAEARIHTVVVGTGITMIGGETVVVGRVVLQDGRKPQGGNTQLVEVIEVLADAFQVAAMAQAGLAAVVHIRVQAFDLVVVTTA